MERRNNNEVTVSFSIKQKDLYEYVDILLEQNSLLDVKIDALDLLEWAIKEDDKFVLHKLASIERFIIIATIKNDISTVEKLIEAGADINLEIDYSEEYECTEYHNLGGKSLIDIAVEKNYIEMAKLLISKGANINSSICDAVYHGNIEMVELLLKSKAIIHKKINDKVVADAIKNGDLKMLKLLIKYGAKVKDIDEKEENHLANSLRYGYPEIAEFLIKNGADVKIWDDEYFVVLAVSEKYKKIVSLLIENGAKFTEGYYSDSLAAAAENDDVEIVKLLLEAGAKVNNTAMIYAIFNDNLEIAQLLLDNGAIWEKERVEPYDNSIITDDYSKIASPEMKQLIEQRKNLL